MPTCKLTLGRNLARSELLVTFDNCPSILIQSGGEFLNIYRLPFLCGNSKMRKKLVELEHIPEKIGKLGVNAANNKPYYVFKP